MRVVCTFDFDGAGARSSACRAQHARPTRSSRRAPLDVVGDGMDVVQRIGRRVVIAAALCGARRADLHVNSRACIIRKVSYGLCTNRIMQSSQAGCSCLCCVLPVRSNGPANAVHVIRYTISCYKICLKVSCYLWINQTVSNLTASYLTALLHLRGEMLTQFRDNIFLNRVARIIFHHRQ